MREKGPSGHELGGSEDREKEAGKSEVRWGSVKEDVTRVEKAVSRFCREELPEGTSSLDWLEGPVAEIERRLEDTLYQLREEEIRFARAVYNETTHLVVKRLSLQLSGYSYIDVLEGLRSSEDRQGDLLKNLRAELIGQYTRIGTVLSKTRPLAGEFGTVDIQAAYGSARNFVREAVRIIDAKIGSADSAPFNYQITPLEQRLIDGKDLY